MQDQLKTGVNKLKCMKDGVLNTDNLSPCHKRVVDDNQICKGNILSNSIKRKYQKFRIVENNMYDRN